MSKEIEILRRMLRNSDLRAGHRVNPELALKLELAIRERIRTLELALELAKP